MSPNPNSDRVAVIGSGLASAACAAGLRDTDAQVTLFEKARHAGGRTATRRVGWVDVCSAEQAVTFDHGAQSFTPVRPRFKAVTARSISAGCVSEWRPRVHAAWPAVSGRCLVATPTMPALCSHLLAGTTVHLAGHRDDWAEALMAKRMQHCWTVMAVTDDVDWTWDAAEPNRRPLERVVHNDRVPGRTSPLRLAVWTAHATAEWSAAHREDDAQTVNAELQLALRAQLPATSRGGQPVRWHHADVHRWRDAEPACDCDGSFDSSEAWWDDLLGLGVCGDFLAGGGVEAARHSGDELADFMAASVERMEAESLVTAAMR